MANFLTIEKAQQKANAGFTHMVVCVKEYNGWKMGQVMKFAKSAQSAERHAGVRNGNARVYPLPSVVKPAAAKTTCDRCDREYAQDTNGNGNGLCSRCSEFHDEIV